MNIEKDKIDTDLYDSNSFLSGLHFSKLDKKKANKLSKKLEKNVTYENNVKLNDVIKGKSGNGESSYY